MNTFTSIACSITNAVPKI